MVAAPRDEQARPVDIERFEFTRQHLALEAFEILRRQPLSAKLPAHHDAGGVPATCQHSALSIFNSQAEMTVIFITYAHLFISVLDLHPTNS